VTGQPSMDQIEASRAILESSQLEREPYAVDVCGSKFVVLPDVFSPKYFGSTPIFTGGIATSRGERFLEIGSGSGATAVVVARRGASVVAVDINPMAVKNTRLNAALHGVDNALDAREGDVFSGLVSGERFDSIYWNMPFIRVDAGYEYRSVLERSLYDPGYRYLNRFLSEARNHLADGGRVLIGFGDFGDIGALRDAACDFQYSMKELLRATSFEGNPVTFLLYELCPLGAIGSAVSAS
jgi:release factor glutamine methyltransferase